MCTTSGAVPEHIEPEDQRRNPAIISDVNLQGCDLTHKTSETDLSARENTGSAGSRVINVKVVVGVKGVKDRRTNLEMS